MDASGGYRPAAIRDAEIHSANSPVLCNRDPHVRAHTTKHSGHRVPRC